MERDPVEAFVIEARRYCALDAYWEVFDPYEEKPLGIGLLSDDLLDVYVDIRRGLDLWSADVPREAAIWEWRFHLEIHWGDHAVDAIRALHRACYRISGG